MNVNYYLITAEKWATLQDKDAKSFYLVGDTDLYLGEIKLSNAADLATAVSNIAKNAEDIETINETLDTLMGEATEDGSIAKMIKDAIDTLDGELAAVAKSGEASDVAFTDTTTKLESTDVNSAINEVMSKVQQAAQADEIEVVKQDSAEEGYAATYIVNQGGVQAGVKINIPKDYFAKDASVKTVTEADKPVEGYKVGQKYIDIEVNVVDASEDTKHLYILCDDVITPYSPQANATQIQLAISDSNEISGTIVAKSVTATELDDAINSALALANSAIQEDDLGSAAFEDADAFDEAGAADTVKSEIMGDAETAQATDKTIEGLVKKDAEIDGRLDDLEEAIGEGGTVDEKIAAALEELDETITADEGYALTGVTQTDGKLAGKTQIALTAENIKVSGMSAYSGTIEDVKAALEEVATHLTWQTIADEATE